MRINFNDDNTNKGLEGWYEIIDKKLIVFLHATNCREDWLSNFKGFPLYSGSAHCFIHAGYKKYSQWMADFITDLISWNDIENKDVLIFGYSMGGGISQIVGVSIPDIKIISIDGPRTTSKINDKMKLIFNRGSLVHNIPFWFKRIKQIEILNNKWRPFWKAHADYDINKIVKENI